MKYRVNASEPWKELYIKALDSMPIGMMVDFVGTDIPNGWLICDGSTLDEETYPELYDALGGSGSTFTLPDCKGRVLVGYDANDTNFNAIGKTGGEKTHTLTIDEMPKHNHKVFYTDTGGGGNLARLNASGSQTPTTEAGGDQPHNNLQPYYVAYKIIKAKNTTPTMASIVNTKNNSTTDGYSCDYVNKLHTYSFNEIKVGTWVDGKPIYRKVIETNFTSGGSTQKTYTLSELGLTNMETVIELNSFSQGDPMEQDYYSASNDLLRTLINAQGLGVIIGSKYPTRPCLVYTIIEYTKTTD